MDIKKRIWFALVLLFAVIFIMRGSSHEQKMIVANPADKTGTVAYHTEEVWNGILDLLEEWDVDLDQTFPDSLILITLEKPIEADSELGLSILFLVDDEHSIYKAKYTLAVILESTENNSTTIRTEFEIKKFVRTRFRYYKFKPQPSNGILERKFFTELEKRLRN